MDLDSSLDNKDCESSENSTSMLRCDETLELANDWHSTSEVEISDTKEFYFPLYNFYVIEFQRNEAFYHPRFSDITFCSSGISNRMRGILIDWISKTCSDYNYKRESFHNSISLLDRILSIVPSISPQYFQLYGIVALYISLKTIVIFT